MKQPLQAFVCNVKDMKHQGLKGWTSLKDSWELWFGFLFPCPPNKYCSLDFLLDQEMTDKQVGLCSVYAHRFFLKNKQTNLKAEEEKFYSCIFPPFLKFRSLVKWLQLPLGNLRNVLKIVSVQICWLFHQWDIMVFCWEQLRTSSIWRGKDLVESLWEYSNSLLLWLLLIWKGSGVSSLWLSEHLCSIPSPPTCQILV